MCRQVRQTNRWFDNEWVSEYQFNIGQVSISCWLVLTANQTAPHLSWLHEYMVNVNVCVTVHANVAAPPLSSTDLQHPPSIISNTTIQPPSSPTPSPNVHVHHYQTFPPPQSPLLPPSYLRLPPNIHHHHPTCTTTTHLYLPQSTIYYHHPPLYHHMPTTIIINSNNSNPTFTTTIPPPAPSSVPLTVEPPRAV